MSIAHAAFPWSDVLAVALGVGVASAELASNHTNFTLNNMVACLVATDILQVAHACVLRGAWCVV